MNNLQYILLIMTIFILMALIIFININIKLSKMNRRYQKMMQGMDGSNLENILVKQMEEVRKAMNQVEELTRALKRLETVARHSVQKIGVVRFNAFEDTGSDLSYAVALLDGENNGVVLSSIFGRNESRDYAKPIVGGSSSYFLTEEEKRALMQAQGGIQEQK
ncbi:DUF4446 family protein [Lucifera butyrica]|nr:DUF4446 family protein [Lucifera butyrica]